MPAMRKPPQRPMVPPGAGMRKRGTPQLTGSNGGVKPQGKAQRDQELRAEKKARLQPMARKRTRKRLHVPPIA